MGVELRDERLKHVIAPDAELQQVVSGFEFTEGPVWHPHEKFLIFSDIIGDTMYRWGRTAGATIFRRPSHMANGNTFDREGRLLTCEHATSRVTRTDHDGRVEVMASHHEGKELNSPNDIVVKSNGDIYFTDPASGRSARYGVLREQELPFQGVYRISPETKELTLLVTDFDKPNGLCFSLDEKLLFVNDTARGHIRVFEVLDDGTVGTGRLWAEVVGTGVGVPDGMKVDLAGNLFCCGPGGIHVFDSGANCLGVIRIPEHAANFTWGDDDLCSLYVTAATSVYRVRTEIPGRETF